MRELHRQSDRLQRDRWLLCAKITVGVLSAVLLGALFVTSLLRAPNDLWTYVTAGIALLILVAIGRAVRARRRSRQ